MLRYLGALCGLLSILLGVWNLFTSLLSPSSIILGVYNVLFGLLMIISEFRWLRLLKHFKFLTHFIGLGMFYIFVGGLALGSAWYELGLGITMIILGSVYFTLGLFNKSMKNQTLPNFIQKQDSDVDSSNVDKSIQQQPVTSTYAPPSANVKTEQVILNIDNNSNKLSTHNDTHIAVASNINKADDYNPFE